MSTSPPRNARARSDERWGRAQGARPPIAPWVPAAWWLVTAIALVVAVAAVVRGPGPLDDPHEGRQRPGVLTAPDDGRSVRGLTLPGDPVSRRPALVIFDRRARDRDALARFVAELPERFATVVVLADHGRRGPREPRVLVDRAGRVARAVGMPRPRDGGPPVGYALIDSSARVRYATLDPGYTEHRFELRTVAKGVR